jgi:hypothetical protein
MKCLKPLWDWIKLVWDWAEYNCDWWFPLLFILLMISLIAYRVIDNWLIS